MICLCEFWWDGGVIITDPLLTVIIFLVRGEDRVGVHLVGIVAGLAYVCTG